MALTGTLKKFMSDKGFGFIERDDGQGDIFVHFSKLTSGSAEDMVVGSQMTFDEGRNYKTGKSCAEHVTIAGSAVGGDMGNSVPGTMFTCISLDQWISGEAGDYQGLRIARSIDPHRWQYVADELLRTRQSIKDDNLYKQTIRLDGPEASLQDEFQKAALGISHGLPDELAKLVSEDAQALAGVMYKMLPKAQGILIKLQLFGDNVCLRWHEDQYVCRSIVSYNCSATQYTAHSNVNFDELYYCGNNECIIRDKSQICSAYVGDIVMMKGTKFPGKAKGLVHKSPEVCYHDNGEVKGRIILKVDVQDMAASEVNNTCVGY